MSPVPRPLASLIGFSAVLPLLALLSMTACSRREPPAVASNKSAALPIELRTKSITTLGDYVVINGHWKQIAGPKAGVAKLNSIYLECSKTKRVCEETRAEIWTSDEWKTDRLTLEIQPSEVFPILSWSNGTIVARREAPVADIDLKISTTDQTAERSFRETRARGSETADPNVWRQYVLE